MMRRALLLACFALALSAHTNLSAQVRRLPEPRRDTVRTRPDTSRHDSTAADSTKQKELIKWNEPDSVMRVLMARPGYSATRYQGDVAVFLSLIHISEPTRLGMIS